MTIPEVIGLASRHRCYIIILTIVIVSIFVLFHKDGTSISTAQMLTNVVTAKNTDQKVVEAKKPEEPKIRETTTKVEEGLKTEATTKSVPMGYEFAADYFATLGYMRCEKRSKAQEDQKLWMFLRSSESKTCSSYFQDFLDMDKLPPPVWPPPSVMPSELKNRYLLDGRITKVLTDYNQRERYNGAPIPYYWSPQYVQSYIDKVTQFSIDFLYRDETNVVYRVVNAYNLTGMRGIVIGSETPWVESILLVHGKVKNILTLEYHPINATHPQLSWVHPKELCTRWEEFQKERYDFVFTFSSLEHSGLGRYGDRLDPDGDLKDMRRLACLLPEGALVFLGIPVGEEGIDFNAHRVYNKWRLPLMSANFEVDAVFFKERLEDPFAFMNAVRGRYNHVVIVLRNRLGSSCD